MRATVILVLWLSALAVSAAQTRSVFPGTLDQHPAIDYKNATAADPASQLQRVVEGGAPLTFEGEQGYLRAVLSRLNVPEIGRAHV